MTDREEEKLILDRLVALRDTEVMKLVARLLKARLEMHKTSLVSAEGEVVRGKAQECRHLLKELRLNGD